MKQSTLACLAIALCAAFASAQFASAQTTSPSAYVYLVNSLSNRTTELDGYSADSNGSLTPLPGSPFWTSSSAALFLAHTSHWLFVSDGHSTIYSFSIVSDGSLKLVTSFDAAQYATSSDETVGPITLDHTGSTLYALATDSSGDNHLAPHSTRPAATMTGASPDFSSSHLFPLIPAVAIALSGRLPIRPATSPSA